jgi:3',5'-cyclic-AMP phosphodiesterase
VTKPFLLVQLSDPHIGANWAAGDPVPGWEAALESVRRLPDPPDAVLVTGDLADHGEDGEYAVVKSTLETLDAPAYVLPGNHDRRLGVRTHFGLPGEGDAPVRYAADLGPLRLIALDTTRPGHDSGELGTEQLDWLATELASAPDRPTLLAMHHPPFATGSPVWDAIGLDPSHRVALADVIRPHRQVLRIVAGHVHRPIAAELAGRVALSIPSTYVQGRLRFDATELELIDEPAGFAIHALHDGEIASHLQAVVG